MSRADLIFCPLNDLPGDVRRLPARGGGDFEALAARYPDALIVMTLGAGGRLSP